MGLIAGLPIDGTFSMQGGMQQPWPIMGEIKKPFEVETIDETAGSIPDNIDVLMIVHPFGLSDKTLYAIDQFVMAGGKTMVFVDPFAEEGSRSNAAMRLPPDHGSNLEKLFKAWGVEYARDKVLADLGLAAAVDQFRRGGRHDATAVGDVGGVGGRRAVGLVRRTQPMLA